LDLEHMQSFGESWIHILQATPNLRVLVLRDISLTDTDIERLSIPGDATNMDDVVCPSLTTLKLLDVSGLSLQSLIASSFIMPWCKDLTNSVSIFNRSAEEQDQIRQETGKAQGGSNAFRVRHFI
jgi:hypothetical protein